MLIRSDGPSSHSDQIGSEPESDYFYRIRIELIFIGFESDNFVPERTEFASTSNYTAIPNFNSWRIVHLKPMNIKDSLK